MHTLIVKEGIVVYVDPHSFAKEGTWSSGSFDPTTRTDNAVSVQLQSLPDFFMPGRWSWTDGRLEISDAYAEEVLPAAREKKLSEINAVYEKAIALLTPTYPDSERLTFDKQESEARAYAADAATPTPHLSALAAARGIELAELVRRVIVKADAFAVASGSLTGQRQRIEDQLDAATTFDGVQSISVSYTLGSQEVTA